MVSLVVGDSHYLGGSLFDDVNCGGPAWLAGLAQWFLQIVLMTVVMDQLQVLLGWFQGKDGVLTALSGGVDSCLVAWAARQVLPKEKAVAVIGDSPSLKRRDYDTAVAFCQTYDIQYVAIAPNEMDDPNYRANLIDRCFWCKSSLYTEMLALRNSRFPGFTVLNGNNKSDWSDYRPGLKAADQFEAQSPLADCGLVKDDIRQIAQQVGLPMWDKPASPCLSSRFPYGEAIDIQKLKVVEDAEEWLALNGFADARVRYLGQLARVEVPVAQIDRLLLVANGLEEKLKSLGFTAVEIDREGLVSGKLNRGVV